MFAIACLGDDRKDSNDFSNTLERIDTELEIIREARAAAAERLRTAVALELSPGSMWAAGRLGLRDLGNGLIPRRARQLLSAGEADSDAHHSDWFSGGESGRWPAGGIGAWDLHDQSEHHQLQPCPCCKRSLWRTRRARACPPGGRSVSPIQWQAPQLLAAIQWWRGDTPRGTITSLGRLAGGRTSTRLRHRRTHDQ